MTTQSPVPDPNGRAGARKRWRNTGFHLLIVLSILAGYVALWWVDTLPQRVDDQQTIVVGQTRFAPDSDASVRVVVQDFAAGEPVAGAQVSVSLKPSSGRAVTLYEGTTDENGSLPVSFHVPADMPADATLVVETHSEAGRDRVEQPVTIERDYRLLLTSDKPLYQPGQTIHMRALALSTLDLTPARGATVSFLVEDPRGNKVFRQSVLASDYGVAAADFVLADLVNQGDYKLSVSIGDTISEMTVEVRPYVLPKFGVTVSTERSYYLPGQHVEGVVQADYFFGKPVSESQVQIVGSAWDVERVEAIDLQGQTDEDGTYAFAFDLPEYFAGSGLESWQAQFALEVTVVDQTNHAEQTSLVLPVAEQPLVIEAVAESGVLKPGVENIIYVLTSYPDGQPAQTTLEISVDGSSSQAVESGEYGLAEFFFTPQEGEVHFLDVAARDRTGLQASRRVEFAAEGGADSVLLRADRAAYVVGETMTLAALTPVESGSIYLDIVKAGQTLSTRSARVQDGRAEFAVDVSPDLYGTLELHAYKVLLDGTIVRDTRVVVVDAPNEVSIDVTADRETYLPGETAVIDLQTSGEEGGLQTALGIAIVDESVFALQRQDPGFAKLYFLLQQELLEPFYQVKGFEMPASVPPDEQEVRQAQDDAVRAAWAGLSVSAGRLVNSREVKIAAVYQAQDSGFKSLGLFAVLGMILVPLLLWGVAIVALRQVGDRKRALVRFAVTLGLAVLVGGCLAGWLLVASEMFYELDPGVILVVLAASLGLALLAFVVAAWVKRDPAAKFLALLTLAWGGLVFLLIQAVDRGGDLSEGWIVAGLLACALIPGAYLLFGQVRWLEARRFAGAAATCIGAIGALPAATLLPLILLLTFSGGMAAPLAGTTMPLDGDFAMPVPAMRESQVEVAEDSAGAAHEQAAGVEPPRLRQFFPETLYWAPEVLTDEGGFVSLELPMADSITTWRLTALASSQDGRLGFVTRGIRVFQDFFVDIDLPVALTQGDEISIPVGVFNYLQQAQEVRLVVEEEDWFELLGEAEQTLTIEANDIQVVYFPIRVREFGQQGFQVTAWGEQMSDAIRRQVAVLPDGQEVRLTQSDWLREDEEIAVAIPVGAVAGTEVVEIKIYPGVMAQAVEGLEKILRLPHG